MTVKFEYSEALYRRWRRLLDDVCVCKDVDAAGRLFDRADAMWARFNAAASVNDARFVVVRDRADGATDGIVAPAGFDWTAAGLVQSAYGAVSPEVHTDSRRWMVFGDRAAAVRQRNMMYGYKLREVA